jgi:hemerythrin superfamily protein
MDATKLLSQQHAIVTALFQEYEQTDDEEEKLQLFEQIADNLAAHAAIEERLFYPAAYIGEAKGDLEAAVEEHLSVKRLITDLLVLTPEDQTFDAKMKVLKEQVKHHVEEEETILFAKVRQLLPSEELARLGEAMDELFLQLMAEGPSDDVPTETDIASPLP